MKKIGIVTYYNAINNGAFLQAYAMQTFLQENGYDPYFLTVKRFSPSDNTYSKEYATHLYECQDKLKLSNTMTGFDAVVYGSDEIWNLRNSGLSPYFWGYKVGKSVKVVYAACTGNTRLSDYFLFPYTILGLRKFSAISVRDLESYNKISKLTRKDIAIVLDPTFLINYDSFKMENHYGKYILVYTYGLRQDTISKIKDYASETGSKIICTGSYADWADLNLCANPFEWVSLIQNAEIVFSSTFHGTVFSIICNKQFYVVDTESAKVKDLLEKLNLSKRKTYDFGKTGSIDYSKVNECLAPLIGSSKKFLLENLK